MHKTTLAIISTDDVRNMTARFSYFDWKNSPAGVEKEVVNKLKSGFNVRLCKTFEEPINEVDELDKMYKEMHK